MTITSEYIFEPSALSRYTSSMNTFLRLVPSRWYMKYQVAMMIFCLGVIGLAVAFALNRALWPYEPNFKYLAVSISAIALLIYNSVLYLVRRNIQSPLTTMVSIYLFVFVVLSGLDGASSLPIQIYFAGGWLMSVFLGGMYGVPLMLGAAFLGVVYACAGAHFSFEALEPLSCLVAVGGIIMAIFGYFFWKKRYVGPQQDEIDRLSVTLRNNQRQSLILLESLQDGVVITDTQGTVTGANTSTARLIGSELKGRPINEALAIKTEKNVQLAQADNPFMRALQQRRHSQGTYMLTKSSGEAVPVSIVVSPIVLTESNELEGVIGVIRDMSRELAVEREREDFVMTASHEMRTPLATLEGYLSLIRRKKAQLDPQVNEFIDKSYGEVEHMSRLFRDLLTVSQLEENTAPNADDHIDLTAAVSKVVADYTARASQPIQVSVPDVSLMVRADTNLLSQAIGNLIDNALKYGSPTQPVQVQLTQGRHGARLEVTDAGPGIPAEVIPKLFTKFFRVDNSATRTVGGTGLGLFITKRIVERSGGTIGVTSNPGQGSTFFIELPTVA